MDDFWCECPHDDWSKHNLLRATQPDHKLPDIRKHKRDVLLKSDEGEQSGSDYRHKLDLVYFGKRN